jgi:HlyD family secretion protein
MRKFLIPIVLLVLIGGGAAFWYLKAAASQPATYRTEPLTRGDLMAAVSATGTLEPTDVVDVGAQVAGMIKEFGTGADGKPIDYGSPVEKGTVLARIDDSLYAAKVTQSEAQLASNEQRVLQAEAKLEQAEANTRRARADLESAQAKAHQSELDMQRADTLYQQGNIAKAEYDAAVAALGTNKAAVGVADAAVAQAAAAEPDAAAALGDARAAVELAKAVLAQDRINLGYCTIVSPVKGVIIDRRVTIGQTVQSSFNTPSLFLIALDMSKMKVWASVNEADVSQIRLGQPVRFSVDAYPQRTFTGSVGRIRLNATNVQNVVVYTVEVVTDNQDGKLLPYMTANLQFEVDRRPNALLVPNTALRFKPSGKPAAEKEKPDQGTVWVEENGQLRPVTLKLGLTDGANTEVLSGDVEPGMKLAISEAKPKSGGGGNADTTNPFAPKVGGGKKQ